MLKISLVILRGGGEIDTRGPPPKYMCVCLFDVSVMCAILSGVIAGVCMVCNGMSDGMTGVCV